MRKAIALLLLLFAGCASMPTKEEIATADYGPEPKNPREIVLNFIDQTFKDPHSVIDLKISTPEKFYHGSAPLFGMEKAFGWVIAFECNAKNSYGGYTGRETFYLFVTKGKVEDITKLVNLSRK